MAHTYKELAKAEEDLKTFSSLDEDEDTVLFLVNVPGGMQIVPQAIAICSRDTLEAVAINGIVFVRK